MKTLIVSTFVALTLIAGVAGAQAGALEDSIMVGQIVHPGGITGGR